MTNREGVQLGEAALRIYTVVSQDYQREIDCYQQSLGLLLEDAPVWCRELADALLTSIQPAALQELDRRYQLECWSNTREIEGEKRLPFNQRVSLFDRRRLAEKAFEKMGSRQKEIEASADYQDRQRLLDPYEGALGGELERLRQRHEAKTVEYDRIWKTDFARVYHPTPPQRGIFQTFWRGLIFAETREQWIRDALPAKLGYVSWDQLVAAFQRIEAERLDLWQQREPLDKRQQTLVEQIAESQENAEWLGDFDQKLRKTLAEEITPFLVEQVSTGVKMFWIPALQKATSTNQSAWNKAMARVDQFNYLRLAANFLTQENLEIQQEMNKIRRVVSYWKRKFYATMNDKSKWLVDLPAIKNNSAVKKIRWCQQIRLNLCNYRDWEDFEAYRSSMPRERFLAFDAFTWGSSDPMPYDGFLCSLYADVREHRQRLSLKKADFEPYKQVDQQTRAAAKIAEREARQAARELQRHEKAEAAAAAAIAAAALLAAQAAENEVRMAEMAALRAEQERRNREELDDRDSDFVEHEFTDSTYADRS